MVEFCVKDEGPDCYVRSRFRQSTRFRFAEVSGFFRNTRFLFGGWFFRVIVGLHLFLSMCCYTDLLLLSRVRAQASFSSC